VSKTARWAAIFGVLALLWIGGCLVVEFQLLAQHQPPFTAWWRTIWANEPWPIFLGAVVVVGIVAFLFGHFVAADRKTYDDIREGRKK